MSDAQRHLGGAHRTTRHTVAQLTDQDRALLFALKHGKTLAQVARKWGVRPGAVAARRTKILDLLCVYDLDAAFALCDEELP